MNSDWTKSSASAATGCCLEARWRKSSACVCGAGSCVEARRDRGMVEVRDSKDKTGPVLAFGPAAWLEFLYDFRAGDFDLPV